MLQAVFEQLYFAGFREFCIIVGRGKRAIMDHFTPDWDFIKYLEGGNKVEQAEKQYTDFSAKCNCAGLLVLFKIASFK